MSHSILIRMPVESYLRKFLKSKVKRIFILNLLYNLFPFIFHRRKGLGEPDEAKVASLTQQLNDKLDVYEKILSKQPYLGGQVS